MKTLVMVFCLLAGHLTAASPLIKGRFQLVDARNGKSVSQASYQGQLRLVYFGFTHCRITCPLGLARMRETQLLLTAAEQAQVAFLFITTDPQRDSKKLMKDYAAHFSPTIIPLAGRPKAVAAAMRSFRLEAHVTERDAQGGYQMDHPALLYLMDRNGDFIETQPLGVQPQELAKRMRQALKGL